MKLFLLIQQIVYLKLDNLRLTVYSWWLTQHLAFRIWRLKRQARTYARQSVSYKEHMDCGYHMAKIIRPDIQEAEDNFDTVMDELKRIDPKFGEAP